MSKMGKFNIKGMKDFQKQLEKIEKSQVIEVQESIIKELAARLYAKAVKKTPVGDYDIYKEVTAKRDSKNHKKGDKYLKAYSTGKKGGTLRRGWIIGPMKKTGNGLQIEVFNPVEYASYVEYGHRQEPGRYVPALGKKIKIRVGSGAVHAYFIRKGN